MTKAINLSDAATLATTGADKGGGDRVIQVIERVGAAA